MQTIHPDFYICSMDNRVPIKRSLQLQSLSKEHHDGLLFVWKIKQGLNNHISMERLRRYTSWYWRQHMTPHFYQEEKILLPLIPQAYHLGVRLKNEHEEMLDLLVAVDRESDSHDLIALINLVEKHIRWEERGFYQYLEQNLSLNELEEVRDKLEKHPITCSEEWPDDFWVKKAS